MTEGGVLGVVGFGYCGRATAARWPGRVVAIGRHLENVPETTHCVEADVRSTSAAALPALDHALITVGTRGNEGLAGKAAALVCAAGARRLVYLSSTSVYGDRGGAVVDADTPTRPDTPMGVARVEAEQDFLRACADAGAAGMVLRLPGIYGPGRTIRARVAAGEYRVPAEPEIAQRWSNRIHRDDVATAVLALLDRGRGGEPYLASDGRPFRSDELVRWVADYLGAPVPPSTPLAEFSPLAQQLWAGSRRCDATKLRQTGWAPRFEDVFEGHLATWAEEDCI